MDVLNRICEAGQLAEEARLSLQHRRATRAKSEGQGMALAAETEVVDLKKEPEGSSLEGDILGSVIWLEGGLEQVAQSAGRIRAANIRVERAQQVLATAENHRDVTVNDQINLMRDSLDAVNRLGELIGTYGEALSAAIAEAEGGSGGSAAG